MSYMNYEERLEVAKRLYELSNTEQKTALECIFPELRESEDEKIRKWIIDDIKYNMNNEPLYQSEYKKEAEKAIAWLEKQDNKNHIEQNNEMVEALRTEYEKGRADAIAQMQKEWSEEDDYMLESIISDFAGGHKSSIGQDKWLKSIRPQNRWKPSDEQMEVLVWCLPLFVDPKSKGILESLINELKKQREE